jgi:hypothetical protein
MADNSECFPGEKPGSIARRGRWVPAFAGTAVRVRFHPGRVGRAGPVANSQGAQFVIPGRRAVANPESIFQRRVFMASEFAPLGRAPE